MNIIVRQRLVLIPAVSPLHTIDIMTIVDICIIGKRQFYTVTSLEWGAYLLFERDTHFLPYLHARRLTQHFIVDLYLCVEKDRM